MEKVTEKFWQEMMKAKQTPDAGKMMKTIGQRDFENEAPGLPRWLSGKESSCRCRRAGFDLWSRKIPPAAEQLSPFAATTEPVLWNPEAAAAEGHVPWSLCSTAEVSTVRSTHTATGE